MSWPMTRRRASWRYARHSSRSRVISKRFGLRSALSAATAIPDCRRQISAYFRRRKRSLENNPSGIAKSAANSANAAIAKESSVVSSLSKEKSKTQSEQRRKEEDTTKRKINVEHLLRHLFRF